MDQKRVSPKDRRFAVIALGVQIGKSGRKDTSLCLEEIASEAIATKSTLLIHSVLTAVGEQAWKKFVSDVEEVAQRHRRLVDAK